MISIFRNKRFITGACVFLTVLCSVLLIIGCPTPFDPSNLYKAPEGMGTFTLHVAGSQTQGRTIMPGTANNEFAWYRLEFVKNGQSEVKREDRTHSQLGNAIELTSGFYTLTVYGYTSEANKNANPHKPAAHGTLSNLEIRPGVAANGRIDLKAYGVGSAFGGKGIFSWDINYPDGLTELKMEVQAIAPTIGGGTYYLVGGAEQKNKVDSVELNAGYYRVVMTLQKPGMRTVIWRETLHVYENMTSSYAYTFSNDHFIKPSYVVTYNYNDGRGVYEELTYFHDEFTAAGKPADPTRAEFTFDDWFKDTAGTEPWVYGTPLTENIVLYAKWIPHFPGGSVTISIVGGEDDYEVDTTLQANFSPDPVVSGVVVQYQWNRNNVPITLNATSQTYKVVLADSGSRISVTVSYQGYIGGITSPQTPEIKGPRGFNWENPFQVFNRETLYYVGRGDANPEGFKDWTLNAYYKVLAPITLLASDTWTPIGTEALPFIGGFDGSGMTIRNIRTVGTSNNQGFFGVIGQDGEVLNVVLNTITIDGGNNVGGIAAINFGEIINSAVTSSNVHGNNIVGGIVGDNKGEVKNCYFTSSVGGNETIGGIAGDNFGNVQNCYSTGSSSGTINVGGIVGRNNASNGTISYCYSASVIAGNNNIGGIIGLNRSSISNCIALNPNLTARVSGTGINIMRVIGLNEGSDVAISNIFARNNGRVFFMITGTTRATQTAQLNGTDIAVPNNNTGTVTLNSVFTGWNAFGWTIPTGNLRHTGPLPTLDIRPQTPVPVLPVPATWGSPVSSAVTASPSSLIRFGQTGGEPGWWTKRIDGSWVSGQMVEAIQQGEIQLDIPGVTNVNTNQATLVDRAMVDRAGNTIGWMRIEPLDSSGNPRRFNYEFTFYVPFESARVMVGLQGEAIPRFIFEEFNGTVIKGSSSLPNGNTKTITFDVKSMGDWSFVEGGLTTVYHIFETNDDPPLYYWKEGNNAFWSFGATEFIYYEEGSNSDHIIIRTTESDPNAVWVDDPAGPDMKGVTINYTQRFFESPRNQLTRSIYVNNAGELVNVGNAVITLTGATGTVQNPTQNNNHGTGFNITSVNITVEYHLDDSFAQFVRSYTANGTTVPLTTNTINLNNVTVTNDNFTLTSVFNF